MAGSVTVTPATLSFGGKNVGTSNNLSFSITTIGFGPFTINTVSGSGDTAEFSVDTTPGILSGGANPSTCTFAPTSTGAKTATFTFNIHDDGSNSDTDYFLSVDGTGDSPPPPALGSFVSVINDN